MTKTQTTLKDLTQSIHKITFQTPKHLPKGMTILDEYAYTDGSGYVLNFKYYGFEYIYKFINGESSTRFVGAKPLRWQHQKAREQSIKYFTSRVANKQLPNDWMSKHIELYELDNIKSY